MAVDDYIIADRRGTVDDSEGADFNVLTDDGCRRNDGAGMNRCSLQSDGNVADFLIWQRAKMSNLLAAGILALKSSSD